MPRVAPFRGLHYTIGADLGPVVCPPYDVIDPRQQAELLARDPHNAVRLELSDASDPHGAAGATLAEWVAEGVLARRPDPVAYRYRHATHADPDRATVEGVVARVLLEPWGDGIRPHEHTMAGPKADRLALLRATRTQLSPILAVVFGAELPPLAPSSEGWHARDGEGLRHALDPLGPDPALLARLSDRPVFVADGHHRYETALTYQAEVRERHPDAAPGELAADWIMMLIVDAERSRLEILATHRLLLGVPTDPLRAIVAGDDPLWQAIPIAPDELATALAARAPSDAPSFGLVLPADEGFLVVGDRAGLSDRLRRAAVGTAVRELDLSAIHVAVLEDRLGITPAEIAAGERLAYTRDEADALRRVASGEADAAILVRPTRLDQMAAVASAGEVMPQKSTYFSPKPLTGLVFNPLED